MANHSSRVSSPRSPLRLAKEVSRLCKAESDLAKAESSSEDPEGDE